ncbi:hypothetical protein ACQ4PT_005396 [Festuca glaucescens]
MTRSAINSSTAMPRKHGPSANPSGNKKRDDAMDSGSLPADRSVNSRKNENVRYRCKPQHLPPIMKRIIGNDRQKGYVEEIGFGSFLSMADAHVGEDRALTLWLVDKFNCDTEALGISIPVRSLVKSVLGIPSGPVQVVEGPDVKDALYYQYSCNSRAKKAKEVADEMCSITDKEPFCIAFMMAILRNLSSTKYICGSQQVLTGSC